MHLWESDPARAMARSQLLPSTLPRYEPATSAQWVSRPEEVLQIRQVLDPRLKADGIHIFNSF